MTLFTAGRRPSAGAGQTDSAPAGLLPAEAGGGGVAYAARGAVADKPVIALLCTDIVDTDLTREAITAALTGDGAGLPPTQPQQGAECAGGQPT